MKKIILPIVLLATSLFAIQGKEMIVYKSPSCACCDKWVDIMKENGFKVTTLMTNSVYEVKAKVGITRETSSCHTALVDGYVVEGHVNYSAVKKMLDEKPDIKGITVPGMPIGSPGMEQGNMKQSYNVLYINGDNSTGIYEKH